MSGNKLVVSATALRTLPVFQGLESGALEEIARYAGMRRVARGVTVVQAGEASDSVYFVLNGSMKVLVSDEDGREVIFTIIGERYLAKWGFLMLHRVPLRLFLLCHRIWWCSRSQTFC